MNSAHLAGVFYYVPAYTMQSSPYLAQNGHAGIPFFPGLLPSLGSGYSKKYLAHIQEPGHSQTCWFSGALRWAAFSSESLGWVSGKRLRRLADICGLLQTNVFWHVALNAQSQSMCWSAKHPQTVCFPICESFLVGPGFFSTWGIIMEQHMDTSLRQSVILRTLNSSGGTCVPLSVSQTLLNSCSSVEVGTALISLQTKKCLCGMWLCTQTESEAQKETCTQKAYDPHYRKLVWGSKKLISVLIFWS